MKKRIISFIIAVIMLTSAAALLSACGGGGGGAAAGDLKNWNNETLALDYGTRYALIQSASDTAGNTYTVYADIRDADSKKIAAFGGELDILDLRGYTIKYTAVIPETQTAAKTVTINVNNTVKPVVKIMEAEGNTYELNEKFTLPFVYAYSPVGEAAVSFETKLFYTEGGGELEKPVSGGFFIPSQSGGYEYRVTVSDGGENDVTIPYRFSIRSAPAAGEIESFDSPGSLTNVWSDMNFDSVEYCDTPVAGVTGTLKLTGSAPWPRIWVRPRQAASAYAGLAYVSYKVYIDPATVPEGRLKYIAYTSPYGGDPLVKIVEAGVWTEFITGTAQLFAGANGNGYSLLFGYNNDGATTAALPEYRIRDAGFVTYVSDIKAIPYSESGLIERAPDSLGCWFSDGFGRGYTAGAVDGVTGCLKLTASSAASAYISLYGNRTQPKEFYSAGGYTHVRIKLYIESSSLSQATRDLGYKTITSYGTSRNIPLDGWAFYDVPLETFFTLNVNSVTTLFSMNNTNDPGLVMYLAPVMAIKT